MSTTLESLAIMQSLAPELYEQIFFHALGVRTGGLENHKGRRRRLITLSHICRGWRTFLLQTPVFWTNVLLCGKPELCTEFFQRSLPLLVDLTIITHIQPKTPDIVAEALSKNFTGDDFGRIRSLRLVTRLQSDATTVLAPLRDYRFPNLSSLDIDIAATRSCTPLNHRSHATIIPLAFSEGLNTLKVAPPCPSWNILGRETLTTLILRRPFTNRTTTLTGGQLPQFKLLGIIAACPRLTTLVMGKLNAGIDDITSPYSNGPVGTPIITKLALTSPIFHRKNTSPFRNPWAGDYSSVFQNLLSEKLEYLELTGPSWDALYHLRPFISSRTANPSHPPLTLMLHLSLCPIDGSFHSELLRNLPRNIHLRISMFPGQDHRYAALIKFYAALAEEFLSVIVYSADGKVIEDMPCPTLLSPRPALIPRILHPLGGIYGEVPGGLILSKDPRTPFLAVEDLSIDPQTAARFMEEDMREEPVIQVGFF